MEKKYCVKCNSEAVESELEDYTYQCLECDEDLFEFETTKNRGRKNEN